MKGQPRREAEVGAATSEEQDRFRCCEGEYPGRLSDQGIHDRPRRCVLSGNGHLSLSKLRVILPGGGVAG